MVTVSVSEARQNLPSVLTTARTEAVVIERHGSPAAVLVAPDLYDRMTQALEEMEDIAAIEASMADPAPSIPWDVVKADLGLT